MMAQLNWLEMPKCDAGRLAAASLFYGADRLVCNYTGVDDPAADIRGYWVHGWTPDFLCVDPDIALGCLVDNVKGTAWVGTKGLESFLREQGHRAKAIGLPIAYLPPRKYRRRRKTLLVMPTHSLEYTKHAWSFDKYAQEIAEIRHLFDEVAVCLNAGCLRNGYWVEEFEAIGVPVIEGADLGDRNALERMRALLSQFEYVTTNGFGSHIAYAAAFGAKTSIYGTFCEFEEEDFKDDEFYCSKPGMIETAVQLAREACVRQNLGELFCHPREAVERAEWGLEQIGYHNRISPAEMRRCFGLEWHQRAREAAEKKATFYFDVACRRLLPGRVRDALAEKRDHVLADRNRELRRLKALPPGMVGTSLLNGETFHFADAESFVNDYKAIFERAELDFPCVKAAPRIIDWGAGAGLASRFWTKKYPSPEIHAFTPEGPLRQALRENIALAGNANAVMHENIEDLTDLLQGSVDFLRIDLGTTGTEILCRAGAKIKSTQRLLVVCQTRLGEQQEMSRVLSLLETCGFRYHITARRSSPNPLLALRAQEGADCMAEIWAYRGERFPGTWPLPDNKQTKAA